MFIDYLGTNELIFLINPLGIISTGICLIDAC